MPSQPNNLVASSSTLGSLGTLLATPISLSSRRLLRSRSITSQGTRAQRDGARSGRSSSLALGAVAGGRVDKVVVVGSSSGVVGIGISIVSVVLVRLCCLGVASRCTSRTGCVGVGGTCRRSSRGRGGLRGLGCLCGRLLALLALGRCGGSVGVASSCRCCVGITSSRCRVGVGVVGVGVSASCGCLALTSPEEKRMSAHGSRYEIRDSVIWCGDVGTADVCIDVRQE